MVCSRATILQDPMCLSSFLWHLSKCPGDATMSFVLPAQNQIQLHHVRTKCQWRLHPILEARWRNLSNAGYSSSEIEQLSVLFIKIVLRTRHVRLCLLEWHMTRTIGRCPAFPKHAMSRHCILSQITRSWPDVSSGILLPTETSICFLLLWLIIITTTRSPAVLYLVMFLGFKSIRIHGTCFSSGPK